MSNCTKYQDMISSYIDGELTFAEKRELMEHIAACPSCKAMLDAYSVIFDGLDDTMTDPPEALKTRVMAAIGASRVQYMSPVAAEKTPNRKKKGSKWITYALSAACLAVIIFTVPKIVAGAPKSADSAQKSAKHSYKTEASNEAQAAPEVSDKAPSDPSNYGTVEDGVKNEVAEPSDAAGTETEEKPEETDNSANTPEETDSKKPSEEPRKLCTVTIFGELPDILNGHELIDNGDNSYTISISKETFDLLQELGYEVYYHGEGEDAATDYIVIFVP